MNRQKRIDDLENSVYIFAFEHCHVPGRFLAATLFFTVNAAGSSTAFAVDQSWATPFVST